MLVRIGNLENGPRPAASDHTQDFGHSFSQYGSPGRQITYIFSHTWRKDMQSDWLQVSQQTTCGGIKIPCRLVFSCSSEVKINSLKEL